MASNVDLRLLKQTKFPPEFNQKVDMKKVNIEVMKKWIAGKMSEILGNEDDVVIELCCNLLEGSRYPEIKKLQIALTGFLDRDTAKFCKELWALCLSAQESPQGVPKELLEAKKLELIQEKIDAEKEAEEARRRKEQETARQKELDGIRQRERGERRRRGDGRRGPRSRDSDRLRARQTRSPPPRRRGSPDRASYRGPPLRRDVDTYIPAGSRVARHENSGRRYERRASISRSVSRTSSRSPSPQRHRTGDYRPERLRQSPSRSPSPYRSRQHGHRAEPYGGYRGRNSRNHGDHRQRSVTVSGSSRSPSPRRYRRRQSSSRSLSRSTTPPPRSRHYQRGHHNRSRSRSRHHPSDRPHGRLNRADRTRAPPFYADDAGSARADIRKDRYPEDGRRSPNRHGHRPRRRSSIRDKSRTRSHSPDSRLVKKRHRSIERYEPVGKRRRNTSSTSPVSEKRRDRADSSGKKELPSRKREGSLDGHEPRRPKDNERQEVPSPTKTETELREALLREKVKSLRRVSNGATKDLGND